MRFLEHYIHSLLYTYVEVNPPLRLCLSILLWLLPCVCASDGQDEPTEASYLTGAW
jgi:hypothetical protein